jgi:hypothetical protein
MGAALYSQGAGSQRNWPAGGGPAVVVFYRSDRAYHGSQSIHRRPGGEGYSQSSYSARHPGARGSTDRYPPYDDSMEYDRRYPEHPSRRPPYDERMSSRRGANRNMSPRPHSYGGPPGGHLHHPGVRERATDVTSEK